MWKNNFKIALRNLLSNKVSSAINLIGLSVGMAAALLIFIWVQNELTFDQNPNNADRIYRINSHWQDGEQMLNFGFVPLFLHEQAKDQIPEIEAYYVMRRAFAPLLKLDDGQLHEEKDLVYVSSNWFEGFDYTILQGSVESFKNNKFSIALTEHQAQQYFGEASALGRQIRVDTNMYTVNLILANNPANSSFQFNAFLPLESSWKSIAEYERDYRAANYYYMTFILSRPDASLTNIDQKLESILAAQSEDDTDRTNLTLEPLGEVHFNIDLANDRLIKQSKSSIFIFSCLGLLLLLTAGLNYINLSTAVAGKRTKEIGLKKVVGASFKHIFFQVLTEAFLISIISCSLALVIVQISLPILSNLVNLPLSLDATNPYIWLIVIGTVVINLSVAGIYPAVMFAGFKPLRLLNANKTAQKRLTLRKFLVITQFTLTIIVLISTGIIYHQLHYIQQKDVGYDRSHVVEIHPMLFRGANPGLNYDRFNLFARELGKIAGFESIALTDASLVNIQNQNVGSLRWEGRPDNLNPLISQMQADAEFQSVFSLKIKKGRWFKAELESDQNNFVINEAATRQFDIPKPIVGQQIEFQRTKGQIIGVLEDFHFNSLHHRIEPLIIRNNGGKGRRIVARVSAERIDESLAKAEARFQELLPDLPFQYSFLDDTYRQMHEVDHQTSLLFQVFGGLLIFISCLGLLGLAIFAAEQRTKEIGIRKILGASVYTIVRLLSINFLKLVMIALLVATPFAWYLMRRWLENFAYHDGMPWWIFILAGLIAVSVAFLTISIESMKAALSNPIDALRSE